MQKKRFQKKGAIELSMTTIIVIIIGITLLSLGLLWVRSTFTNINRISQGAFEKADGAISDIFKEVDKTLSITPPSIELQQNGLQTVQFIVTDFEEIALTVKAKVTSSDKTLDCLFADTLKTESKEYKLESGKQVNLKLIVQEKGGNLGVKVCNVEVPTIKGDNSESLVINVVKSQ